MLKTGKYLTPMVLYLCQVSFENDYNKVVGEVIRNSKDPNKWGIRNLSGHQWTVKTSTGEVRNVDNGGVMPVIPGLKIRFTKEVTGELIK